MLVLRPGIQGNSLTGTASIPGLSVRFRDGILEVKDEETIRLIKASSGFTGGDFVAVDENGEDPFANTRTDMEPAHIISNIKYGHIENRQVSETPIKIPESVKKLIASEAKKMAKAMLPELLKEAVKEMSAVAAQKSTVEKTVEDSPKKSVVSDK